VVSLHHTLLRQREAPRSVARAQLCLPRVLGRSWEGMLCVRRGCCGAELGPVYGRPASPHGGEAG
jgi:hypothetical protein